MFTETTYEKTPITFDWVSSYLKNNFKYWRLSKDEMVMVVDTIIVNSYQDGSDSKSFNNKSLEIKDVVCTFTGKFVNDSFTIHEFTLGRLTFTPEEYLNNYNHSHATHYTHQFNNDFCTGKSGFTSFFMISYQEEFLRFIVELYSVLQSESLHSPRARISSVLNTSVGKGGNGELKQYNQNIQSVNYLKTFLKTNKVLPFKLLLKGQSSSISYKYNVINMPYERFKYNNHIVYENIVDTSGTPFYYLYDNSNSVNLKDFDEKAITFSGFDKEGLPVNIKQKLLVKEEEDTDSGKSVEKFLKEQDSKLVELNDLCINALTRNFKNILPFLVYSNVTESDIVTKTNIKYKIKGRK